MFVCPIHGKTRTLVQEQIPEANQKFMADNNIALYQFGVPGNKVRNMVVVLCCKPECVTTHPPLRRSLTMLASLLLFRDGQEPFVDIPEDKMQQALTVLLGRKEITRIFALFLRPRLLTCCLKTTSQISDATQY